jgi:hypothetical protein
MEPDKPEQTDANDSGTAAVTDTRLTQPGSRDVLKNAHRDLLVKRNQVGAETTEGRLLSTLIQQIANYLKETDEGAKDRLGWSIRWSMAKLKNQSGGQPR